MNESVDCAKCEAMDPIQDAFDTIFDFLDKFGISYGELPWERVRIHSMMLDGDHKEFVE